MLEQLLPTLLHQQMNKQIDISHYRLRIIILLACVFFAALIFRLFYWQVIRGPELALRASRQHQQTTTLKAQRGTIYDRKGEILAGTRNLYHLFLYKPNLKMDTSGVIKQLSEAIPELTTEYLIERFGLNSNWISIKHYLDSDQKSKIESLKIDGLNFEDEYQRYYPEASLSAHILGFVGSDAAGQEQGYFGLEGFFDRQLRGRGGKIKAEKDAHGQPILIGRYQLLSSIEGRSITTTIDKKIQFIVESSLKDGIARYQAKAGNAIVMETKTGKIIAMASYPNYDPSHFSDFVSGYYKNPNVANLFEPGSIFKVVVMAAALDAGVIEPDTQCSSICSNQINIGEYSIKTWNDKYYPHTTMTDVIVHSDNTGMVFAANKLGVEKFNHYLDIFGFGRQTGIEQQEEVTARLKTNNETKEIDLATNSFGQGIAVTPIQMISAVNVIANKGKYQKPSLIEKIDEEGAPPSKPKDVISEEAARKITQMMVEAVDRGESKWAKPKNVSIAGKTGTAQIPISGHYDPEKTIASFVGFFPSANPEYTMLVSLTEPQTSQWGSETAAPLWFGIARQLLL